MRLWPLCLALSGCASCGSPSIAGRVDLAVDVDPATFATLEIRGYGTWDPAVPPSTEPEFRASYPLATLHFPHEYLLESEANDGYIVHLRAWLAHDPTAPAPAPGEPYGKTVTELRECATESPAYAVDVDFAIASPANAGRAAPPEAVRRLIDTVTP